MHSFLLAIYLPLQLFAANPHEVGLVDCLVALLLGGSLPLLVLAVVRATRRNTLRPGLVLSLAVIAFFSYGAIRNAAAGRSILGLVVVSDTFLLVAYSVVFSLGTVVILSMSRSRAVALEKGLNYFSLALVALVLLYATKNWTITRGPADVPDGAHANVSGTAIEAPTAAVRGPVSLPDIYYIILDGYGRDDTLLDRYGLDNSAFLSWLESRGFYIAHESSPNYISTIESLASSLNLRYLDAGRGETDPGKTASIRATLHQRIQDPEAIRFLKQRGYRDVAFDTGIASTSRRRADVFLAPSFGLGEFHLELLELTILAPLTKKLHEVHAARIRFILDELAQLGSMPGPKFVFVHLMVPHPPYVFDREGRVQGARLSFREERLPDASYVSRYTDQVRFINAEMQRVVDTILRTSSTPPILILQGDHGPGFNSDGAEYVEERARILNAYHLPTNGNMELYPSISPVNTFRVVFDHYFAADLGLLPDGYLIDGRPTLFGRGAR